MKHRVHQAYINSNSNIVHPGVYEEVDIDLAEARNKSIVTAVDSTVEVKEDNVDVIPVQRFNDNQEINNIYIQPQEIIKTVQHIKINDVDEKELIKIKYVTKVVAAKVIDERQKERFVDYNDLNKRVPLKFAKKWQDVTTLDFQYEIPMTLENSVKFED